MRRCGAKFLATAAVASCVAWRAAAESVRVDARSDGAPLAHWWSVGVGAGRVNEGLRAGWLEHLARASKECGFKYVRMHDLFNDDMFTYFEDKKGNPIYNFQYVDEVYDRMLALGVRPFVELSFFPSGIAADNTRFQMWYRNRVTFNPSRLGKFEKLVEAFVRHVTVRYGAEEVRKWYFEVWNEPNLYNGFFVGTRSDYFSIYKACAGAVKRVDAAYRVGGPATSNFIADARHDGEILDNKKSVFYSNDTINKQHWRGVWIEEFLAFCAKERLPVDFISCHPYPTDYALDPETGRGAVRYVHSLRDDTQWLRRTVAASAYPNAEIHLTEWSTSPSSRDPMHDELPPAAYIIKASLESAGAADSLMYWTFTDVFEEKGGGQTPFHGGFGMINFQGIAKPTLHAFRMLHALGDTTLYKDDTLCVTKHAASGKVSALVWNYPESFDSHVPATGDVRKAMNEPPKVVSFEVAGLAPNTSFTIETLDAEHGNVIAAYRKMGSPAQLSIAQTAALKAAGDATLKTTATADAHGVARFNITLAPWACVLIRQD